MHSENATEYEREKDDYDRRKLLHDLSQMGITDSDLLQIEQAASGCIDKTIADWQLLGNILSRIGINLPASTPASTVTAICRTLSPDAIAMLAARHNHITETIRKLRK